MKFATCCSDRSCEKSQAIMRWLHSRGVEPHFRDDEDGAYFEIKFKPCKLFLRELVEKANGEHIPVCYIGLHEFTGKAYVFPCGVCDNQICVCPKCFKKVRKCPCPVCDAG